MTLTCYLVLSTMKEVLVLSNTELDFVIKLCVSNENTITDSTHIDIESLLS